MSYDADAPVYDDVEADARRDFACNRSAFPPDDDRPSPAELPDIEDDYPDGHWRRG